MGPFCTYIPCFCAPRYETLAGLSLQGVVSALSYRSLCEPQLLYPRCAVQTSGRLIRVPTI